MEVKLKKKSDPCLIDDLKKLVARERQTLSRILDHLREVETRRLYLARGFPSLFAWMRSELGYSEASAQRRIAAMHLIKEVPEVVEDIKQGEISLSVVSQVQSYFRKENQKRREKRELPLPKAEKLKLLSQLKGSSSRECERKLILLSPELNLPKEKTRPVGASRTLLQFTANQDFMEKIERLKDLTSHQNPSGSYETLFEQAVDLALERLDPLRREARRKLKEKKRKELAESREARAKAKFAVGQGNAESKSDTTPLPASEVEAEQSQTARPDGKLASQSTLASSAGPTAPVKSKAKPRCRHIPHRLRDQIWQRDRGRCQHRDPKTGKICGSKKFLHIDHHFPFALGGEHQVKNLRLRCSAHNRYRSELLFGKVEPRNSLHT